MSKPERFANATGAPVPDNTNIVTAGRRGQNTLTRRSRLKVMLATMTTA
jgi:hypothetical protein